MNVTIIRDVVWDFLVPGALLTIAWRMAAAYIACKKAQADALRSSGSEQTGYISRVARRAQQMSR